MKNNDYNIEAEIEKILKNDSNEEIVLYSNGDVPVRFQNNGLVPYKGSLYTVLSSLDSVLGFSEGDSMVMSITKENDGQMNLYLQTNQKLVAKILKQQEKTSKMKGKIDSFDLESQMS